MSVSSSIPYRELEKHNGTVLRCNFACKCPFMPESTSKSKSRQMNKQTNKQANKQTNITAPAYNFPYNVIFFQHIQNPFKTSVSSSTTKMDCEKNNITALKRNFAT